MLIYFVYLKWRYVRNVKQIMQIMFFWQVSHNFVLFVGCFMNMKCLLSFITNTQDVLMTDLSGKNCKKALYELFPKGVKVGVTFINYSNTLFYNIKRVEVSKSRYKRSNMFRQHSGFFT